jgi:hypothetical protein
MVASLEEIRLAVFDHAGNLLRIDRHEIPQEPRFDREEREVRRNEICDARLNELGFQSATIKVKRFAFDLGWGGIYDFAILGCDQFDRPDVRDEEGARLWLTSWMQRDGFVWDWGGDDMWLDRKTGEVTDT